jgi:hypothetical protein
VWPFLSGHEIWRSALPCLVPLPKEMENLKLSMKRQ